MITSPYFPAWFNSLDWEMKRMWERENKPDQVTMRPDFVPVCTEYRAERAWHMDWQVDGQTDFKMDC